MKKILFTALCCATPHLETELEIIEKHILSGDDIYYTLCPGGLKTCFLYQSPTIEDCIYCRQRHKIGISLLSKKIKVIGYPYIKEKNNKIYEFSNVDELKKFSIDGNNFGLCAASTLISIFENESFDTKKYAQDINDQIDTAHYIYNVFTKLLDEVNPDLVYIFNGRFSVAAPIIAACNEKNINFFTHERANVDDRYRIINNALPHDVTKIVQECNCLYTKYGFKAAKEIAHTFYTYRKEKNPSAGIVFTKRQKERCLPKNFNIKKKNIVFFNSSYFEYAALPGFDAMTGFYKDEADALQRIAHDTLSDPSIHIYFRMHPNLSGKNTQQVNDILSLDGKFQNLTILSPESPVDSYALMEKSSIVVVFHSTMGAEASYWGKPVIISGFATYGSMEGFYKPQTHPEMIKLLSSDLTSLPPIGAIKYGLWMVKGGTLYKNYVPSTMYTGKFKYVDIDKYTYYKLLPKKLLSLIVGLSGLNGSNARQQAISKIKRLLTRSHFIIP